MEFVLKDSAAKVKLGSGFFGIDLLRAIPDDLYFSGILSCRFKSATNNFLVTTASEVIIYDKQGEVWRANLAELRVEPGRGDSMILSASNVSVKIGLGIGAHRTKVQLLEHFATAQQTIKESETLVATLPKFVPAVAEISLHKVQPTLSEGRWPNAKIIGSKLRRKASDSILRESNGDKPWFILVTIDGGLLAAFDDRLTIIKTGAITSLMSGSFGGGRTTTVFFRDVTGLEYNSGILTGVLEVLTASYQGTANKDFWRGRNQSRNADSNDPFTLSNTLPLSKIEYNNALDEIRELRRRISTAKAQVVIAPSSQQPPSTNMPSLGDELIKLAELNKAGVLSDDEFQNAKKRLLG